MDPNHRHELEENDLAVFLANSKKLWGKYGTALLLTALVVVGGLYLYNHFSQKTKETRDKVQRELDDATSPSICFKLAKENSDTGYKVRAFLKGAEIAAAKTWQADPAGSASFTEADRQSALQEAETGYQGILNISEADLAFKLNARLGLATVAESRHQWDAARKQYQEIEQAAGDTYPAIAAQAKAKAARLPDLEKSLAYGPDPASQPPFLLTTLPSTMPVSMPAISGLGSAAGATTRPAGVAVEATSAPAGPAHP